MLHVCMNKQEQRTYSKRHGPNYFQRIIYGKRKARTSTISSWVQYFDCSSSSSRQDELSSLNSAPSFLSLAQRAQKPRTRTHDQRHLP